MNNVLEYDHLEFIGAAYGLFVAATLYFAIGTRLRLAAVARRLQACDPRTRLPK